MSDGWDHAGRSADRRGWLVRRLGVGGCGSCLSLPAPRHLGPLTWGSTSSAGGWAAVAGRFPCFGDGQQKKIQRASPRDPARMGADVGWGQTDRTESRSKWSHSARTEIPGRSHTGGHTHTGRSLERRGRGHGEGPGGRPGAAVDGRREGLAGPGLLPPAAAALRGPGAPWPRRARPACGRGDPSRRGARRGRARLRPRCPSPGS